MKKKLIINILMVVCLLIAVGCGGYIAYYYYTSAKSENAVSRLADMIETEEEGTNEKPVMVNVDDVTIQKKFEALYKANQDFIGGSKSRIQMQIIR